MTSVDQVSAYGRARRLASRYCYGVQQHLDRIKYLDQGAEWGHLQNKNDWEIVIIFLSRLRRCLVYLSALPTFKAKAELGLSQFDGMVPDLKLIRDFEEHFDDYSLGKGRNPQIEWGHLESYRFGSDAFSNGVGEITVCSAGEATLHAWQTILLLEPEAKQLGYLTWDDRYGARDKPAAE